MPGTGPYNAGYKIPELVVSDTFHDWFQVTNQEIIDKLNRMQVYTVGTGDGISGSTASDGTATFEIADYIDKGITFGGDIVFNGSVTRVNSTDFSVDDYHLVLGDIGPQGATSAGTGADDSVIAASGGGGLILRRGEAEDATWLWKPVDVAGASSGAWHSGETGDSHIRMAAASRFLSSDDIFRFSGGSSGEWLGIHHQNIPDKHYWGGTGAREQDDLVLSYGSSYGATSEFMRVHDDGYVDIKYGVNKKRLYYLNHGFTFGEAVRYDISAGYTWAKADDSSRAEALGLVSYVNGNTFDVTYFGEIRGDFSAATAVGGTIGSARDLTPGSAYFLSATGDGKLTTQVTETVNHVQKPMMIATGTGEGLVVNYLGGIIADPTAAASAAQQRMLISATADFRMGDVVRMNSVNGYYERAECNAPEAAESIGVITDTNVAGDENSYYLTTSGVVSFGTDEITSGGMVKGTVFFLNSNCAAVAATGGCLTPDDPDTVGFVRKPIMVAVSSTQAILLNHIGFRISGEIDGTSQLKSMTGKTFVPVEAADGLKMIGQFFRNHAGTNSTNRKGRFHHCGFNSNSGMQLLHIALNGNTASNPIMDNEIGYGNVWDTTQGAPPEPLFPWGTLAEETALAVGWDEYDSQGWEPWINDRSGGSDELYMAMPNSGKRLNIPSNATHIILRMRSNINVSANTALTTYCAQYNHDVIQSNWADQQAAWLNSHNVVTYLDPSTATNEEEEFATVVVPIDPQATGSHIMLAFYGYIKTDPEDLGIYDLLCQIWCDGFYVDDVPVLAPNGVGGEGRRKTINGNFDFWQRGPSFGATAEFRTAWMAGWHLDNDYGDCYTCDRFHTIGATGQNWSWKREEFTFSGVSGVDYLPVTTSSPARYYSRIINGGPLDGVSNPGSMSIQTPIEDATLFHGGKCSYSFWIKGKTNPKGGGTANDMHLRFWQYASMTDGQGVEQNGQSVKSVLDPQSRVSHVLQNNITTPIKSPAFSLTENWRKIIGTVELPSVAGQLTSSGRGATVGQGCLGVQFVCSEDAAGWTGEFSLAQFQLEQGDNVTKFEVRDEAIETEQCQRYFETSFDWKNKTKGWPLADSYPHTGDALDWGLDIYSAIHLKGDRAVGYTHHNSYTFKTTKRMIPTIMPFSLTGITGAYSVDPSSATHALFPYDPHKDTSSGYYLRSTIFGRMAWRGDSDGDWRDQNDTDIIPAGTMPTWWVRHAQRASRFGISSHSILHSGVESDDSTGEANTSNWVSFKDMRRLYGTNAVPQTTNQNYQTMDAAMLAVWNRYSSEWHYNYTADAEF